MPMPDSRVQAYPQGAPTTIKQHHINKFVSSICTYHLKNYVAYCVMHKELVCEECCDLSHHKDHNNQILLLKAASSNFLSDIDMKLTQLASNRNYLHKCKDFNMRNSIRKLIIEFFDGLKQQLEGLQKLKLDEFNKVFKDSNFINIKQKANDLNMKADLCEKYLQQKKNEFDTRNYVAFLTQTQEIEKISKQSEKVMKETLDLLKEQEQ